MTISTNDLLNKMPLLVDMRPDFVLGKWLEVLRQEVITLSERGQFLERTYAIQMQCGVSEYLLDECEEEIHTIKSMCRASTPAGRCSAVESRAIVSNGWCAAQTCGMLRLRYEPENYIKIDTPTQADDGKYLILTATVTPRQGACELDDLFAGKYRNALHYAAAKTALEYPGDGQNQALASTYAKRAEDELTRLWVRHRSGHENKAPILKARRLV